MASKIDNRAVAFLPQSRELRSPSQAGASSVSRSRLQVAARDEFVPARSSRAAFSQALGVRSGGAQAPARSLGFVAADAGELSAAAEPRASIPDKRPLTSTLHFDQDVSVKSLKLDLDLLHKYRGDLKVTLTSPSGKSVVVSDHQGGSADNIQGTFDLSEAFQGESTKGDWVLSVQDDHPGGDVGTFKSWGLHIGKAEVDPGPVTKPADIAELEQRFGWAAGGWQDRLLQAADKASGAADGKTTAAEIDAYLANPTDLQFLTGSAMQQEETDIASKGGSVAVDQVAAGYEQALAAKADQAGNGDGKVTSAEMKTYLTSVKSNTDGKPKTADVLWMPDQLQAQFDARIQDVTGEANPLLPQGKPNDTLLLNQDYMRMAWNKTTRTPDWVSYELSGADIRQTPRWVQRPDAQTDPFHVDPQLGDKSPSRGDYRRFDRGHQKPAHDSPSMDAMNESFLYSNMSAQTAALNQHSWELLERCTNQLVGGTGGKARVVTGSVYVDANGSPLSADQMKWTGGAAGKGVAIPTHSFKIVLLDRPDGTKTAYAYLVPNRNDLPVGTKTDRSAEAKFLQGCRVSVDQLEKLTGYDFFSDLPDDVEQTLEADSTSQIALPDSLRTKEAALLWPQA